MEKKIDLELFRFDVKTDYLTYFAKLSVEIDLEKSLLELLQIIQHELYEYHYSAYGFKINDVVVFDFDLPIDALYKRFGKEWKIEPLNPHLALKDLTINTDYFLQKLTPLRRLGLDELAADETHSIFRNFNFKEIKTEKMNTQDLVETFLLSFLPFAYATPLSVENQDYLGEAYFILAASLYAKHKTTEILEQVCDLENGILNAQNLQTYLFPQDAKFDVCIQEFKMILFDICEDKKIQNFKSKILKAYAK